MRPAPAHISTGWRLPGLRRWVQNDRQRRSVRNGARAGEPVDGPESADRRLGRAWSSKRTAVEPTLRCDPAIGDGRDPGGNSKAIAQTEVDNS